MIITALTLIATTTPGLAGNAEDAGRNQEAPRVHVIIVANNDAHQSALAPLRFADDDGARFYELFRLISDDVVLLSVFDEDTQKVHAKVVPATRPPSRVQLDAALENTFRKIAEAKKAGIATRFYFVYVGHGSLGNDGQGRMHLLDGHLDRVGLFEKVIKPSPADFNHVIIDACNAYNMIAARGGDPDSEAAIDLFLAQQTLRARPRTGVIVATSQSQEVHEWGRYAAGIFSHELRSALIGAADVDGDLAVSYAEAEAFITAANLNVGPQARLSVYSQPPRQNLAEPLFDRKLARGPTLHLDEPLVGPHRLLDSRGIRYADFNLDTYGTHPRLVLVPSLQYKLRSDRGEYVVDLSATQHVRLSTLTSTNTQPTSRNLVDTFHRDLFTLSYGLAYFEGYTSRDESPAPRVPVTAMPTARDHTLAYTSLGAGVVGVGAVVAGAILVSAASDTREELSGQIGITSADGDRIESRLTAANDRLSLGVTMLILGGVATAASAVLTPLLFAGSD